MCQGQHVTTIDSGTTLCAPFLERLPADGISIVVVSESGAQSTVGASDAIAVALDDLQFELGEGPTPDALLRGVPIITPDLEAIDQRRRWPVFVPAAVGVGARGMFSFPMLAGALTVGVVSLYSTRIRPPWSAAVLRTAAGLTAASVAPAVEAARRLASNDGQPAEAGPAELRREVHQASGMLMVQLGCTIDEAIARLRAFAFAQGRPLDVVAREVVAGMIVMSADES